MEYEFRSVTKIFMYEKDFVKKYLTVHIHIYSICIYECMDAVLMLADTLVPLSLSLSLSLCHSLFEIFSFFRYVKIINWTNKRNTYTNVNFETCVSLYVCVNKHSCCFSSFNWKILTQISNPPSQQPIKKQFLLLLLLKTTLQIKRPM